jgi:1,2-diacylglycerol 3-alpha-glucosyltransferase
MTQPLCIAIASSGLGHVYRGIEAWADDLAAALHQRGVAVTLYKGGGEAVRSYEKVVGCLQRESSKNLRLLRRLPTRLSWRLGLGSPYAIEQTTFAWNLIRQLQRHPADILHVQDPLVAIWAQRAHRLRLIKTKTILAHGTEEPVSFLKKIDYVQHLAPWHAEQVRAQGVWKPGWTTIPNFIDTTKYFPGTSPRLRKQLCIPEDAFVVLTVAAIKRWHKRIDYLLHEFAQVQLPNAYLVVAGGREDDTDDLIAEGQQLLGDRVRFLVRFPREQMPELYRAANLFVLASLFEMMPIALIEAAASGLYCVVHRFPVMEWMANSGGLAIDMTATGELTRVLCDLANDSVCLFQQEYASQAHSRVEFSREAVVDRIFGYYRLLLDGFGGH